MTEFEFVDNPPPPDRGRNRVYEDFRDALRGRPGEWAIWPFDLKNKMTAHQTVGNVHRGRTTWSPPGDWEARASGTTVYVRYVGDGKPADPGVPQP